MPILGSILGLVSRFFKALARRPLTALILILLAVFLHLMGANIFVILAGAAFAAILLFVFLRM